jgi:site-specific DNA-adenine methylase
MKTMKKIKPFLIWDDSKFDNVLQLKLLLPKGNRLVEPFALCYA